MTTAPLPALAAAVLLAGCGPTSFGRCDAAVRRARAELDAGYADRLALVEPLLHATDGRVERTAPVRVREAAAAARAALDRSAQALAQTGARAEGDEAARQAFASAEAAQARLRTVLLHLLGSAERSPRLRADAAFRAIQARLEVTEGRVASAQRGLLDALQARRAVQGMGLTGLHAGELALDGLQRLRQGGSDQAVAGLARVAAGVSGVVGVAWELR